MLNKEFVSVDVETVRRAIDICEVAIENTSFCIHDFKQKNSYRQNELLVLKTMERELAKSKAVENELRAVLGWPLRWEEVKHE